MKAVNITLTFNGDAEAAFTFYRSVFGGEFIHIQRLKEMPSPQPLPAEENEKILHISLPVGPAVLSGMDVPSARPQSVQGTNFMVSLDTSSEEETKRIFDSLSAGGVVMMPLADQFWGAYFGMFTDKFGIQWMLNYAR
jgi:PhnB protein